MREFINRLLSLGTIVAQVSLIGGIIYLINSREKGNGVRAYLKNNGIGLAWAVALISTLASLYYSQIAGFPPCELCWFQRLAIYPQVILLGLSLIKKKDDSIVDYSLALLVFGIGVSLYHNYIDWIGGSGGCHLTGVSCLARYVFEYGYVTIPVMSLTSMALLAFFLLLRKY